MAGAAAAAAAATATLVEGGTRRLCWAPTPAAASIDAASSITRHTGGNNSRWDDRCRRVCRGERAAVAAACAWADSPAPPAAVADAALSPGAGLCARLCMPNSVGGPGLFLAVQRPRATLASRLGEQPDGRPRCYSMQLGSPCGCLLQLGAPTEAPSPCNKQCRWCRWPVWQQQTGSNRSSSSSSGT
jgi:hypothetical protein